MKLSNLLINVIKKWEEISLITFALIDYKGEYIYKNDNKTLPKEEVIEEFVNDIAEAKGNNRYSLFKIKKTKGYVLIAFGKSEECSIIGKLLAEDLSTIITIHKDKNSKELYWQRLIGDKLLENEIMEGASAFNINEKKERYVLICKGDKGNKGHILSIIKNISSSKDIAFEYKNNEIILIHESKGTAEDKRLPKWIVDTVGTELMIDISVSIGTVSETIFDIKNKYNEAKIAMEIGEIFYKDKNVHYYENLGIGRLIYMLPEETCKMFIAELETKNKIKDLDEETLNIIKEFFKNNLNMSETARQLYVHRNTLVYRLDKLSKELGLDIRNFEEAVTLKIAMLISEYLKENTYNN